MKTVIFKWNPAFSSYSMMHYLFDIRTLNLDQHQHPFNWSVWDYEQINEGDKFFWLKVGQYGQTGIVGAGIITSEPYTGEDWSGKGRKTYYVDYLPQLLINPDALPILTADELAAAIPDFEWTGGHSGLVLTDAQAARLDALWADFLARNAADFAHAAALPRGDRDLLYQSPKN